MPMETSHATQDAHDEAPQRAERRRHPRIYYPMPVRIQGSDFEFKTVVQDLSAGGICARSLKKISTGEELRFLVEFALAGSEAELTPKMSATGIVTRVRDLGDGTLQFGARFTGYRFLNEAAPPNGFGRQRP